MILLTMMLAGGDQPDEEAESTCGTRTIYAVVFSHGMTRYLPKFLLAKRVDANLPSEERHLFTR